MKTSTVGYPRIGSLRELKFATEKYFKGEINFENLKSISKKLRIQNLLTQKENNIDYISSNDFSFYDNMLDTAFMLNVIPQRYIDLNLSPIDTYFAVARGYQDKSKDVKAFSMKKWFNTNYHYMVPEFDNDTVIKLNANKIIEEYTEAFENGIKTKPSFIGPFTFLNLSKFKDNTSIYDFKDSIIEAYKKLLLKLNELNSEYIQIDEPYLVMDLDSKSIQLFKEIYSRLLEDKISTKILLQTYFGDIRDVAEVVFDLNFDAIGLDFIEGEENLKLISKCLKNKNTTIFAGVVNGKNIWKNNYKKSLDILNNLRKHTENIVINTSCSLLHVPYTLKNETLLGDEYKKHLSFAEEKLCELNDLKNLINEVDLTNNIKYTDNIDLIKNRLAEENYDFEITEKDITRLPARNSRNLIQKEYFNLPLLPTTTIGSFPQTSELKSIRSKYKKGEISNEEYDVFIKSQIEKCIKLQEDLNLDVLVHGEYERTDMVEYFGANLSGFIFTEKAWVQSYGTRCVKPPVIWSNISRKSPITLKYSIYASSLTKKPVKGMLTGPVTILNWSFPREDISLKDMAYQIAFAIREEVLNLEKNGIEIIQIDEAALKEKLPLRKADWEEKYLDWAIKSFRLVHSSVKPTTQIHTHMCYSEFESIIKNIDEMDADVISFEASRSDLSILEALSENFETAVGPGIYDIHSPRIPSIEELVGVISKIIKYIDINKLWINPDCGLKTRGEFETEASLKNLVLATKEVKNILQTVK